MAKDYAHKPKQAPQGSRIPKWVWVFTTVAVGSFIGFLYFLTQVPEDTGSAQAVREQFQQALRDSGEAPEATRSVEPSTSRETLKDLKEKADAAKKAFEFYELLETDEVPVDLPGDKPAVSKPAIVPNAQPATPPKAKRWIIQVASFAQVADADRVRAQLILNGLPNTDIESVNVQGKGTFHRVMVGPFDKRSALNKAQDILAALSYEPLVKAQQ